MMDVVPLASNTSKAHCSKQTDYENWSREQLIEKIRKLESHVFQLRKVISKRSDSKQCLEQVVFPPEEEVKRKREDGEESDHNPEEVNCDDISLASANAKRKKPRPFDFTRYSTRHVALKFLYLGWNFQGLACQEDTNETIEAYLFNALTMTKLIEERSKSNYHRCGRTDKGVSAFQQVISIDLRSQVVDGEETLDYCQILNRVLPKDIRMVAWAPVRPDFSARFDCIQRTYNYFFPRDGLNLEKMQLAANYLIGEHDFHNLCKPDKDKTTVRRVIKTEIVSFSENGSSPLDMCKLVIVGQSFVWHQIRCIVAILFLVGKELEEPEIVRELLDLKRNPRKPQYSMAADFPLVLYDVQYSDDEGIVWSYPQNSLSMVLSDLQVIWTEHSIKAAMIVQMMRDIEQAGPENVPLQHVNSLMMGTKRKSYQKLLERPHCAT